MAVSPRPQILINQKDNPALKRNTISIMLSDGAALSAANMNRAGYGFDYLASQGSDNFYDQKGGPLSSSNNVLESNGQWGFALSWGGPPTAATNWYPDYHYAGNGVTIQITAGASVTTTFQAAGTSVKYSLGTSGPSENRRIDILNASGDNFHAGCRWGN